MSLNAPKQITFWIAVILVVLGALGELGTITVPERLFILAGRHRICSARRRDDVQRPVIY